MNASPRHATRGRARPSLARLAALGLALGLAGCSGRTLPCPAVNVLREASSVTKFTPGQPADPRNAQYVGQVADAKLSCSYDPQTFERLEVALGVQIVAERNQALQIPAAELQYFVAIVDLQGTVLAKREFPLRLPFPGGSAKASKVEEIREIIPLKYPQNGGSLQVWVGFQLSDAELEYNRAHGS